MCYRTAGWSHEHITEDCELDVIYDVTGVNGCIFGVSDLHPGRAAPTFAIQGPSGTFVWRFLQARCLEEWFWLQYVWCMRKKMYVTRLFGRSWLGVRGQAGKGWKRAVSSVFYSVIMSNLTDVLRLSSSQTNKKIKHIILYLAALRSF